MQKFKYDPSESSSTLLEKLEVNLKDGLTSSEIQNRIEMFGMNVLTQEKPPSLFQVFIKQFKDLMIVILLIAALISALMGDMADTLAIISILALNAIIGTIQESKAHKALSALSHISTTHVMSLRQGIWKMIDATELLPGDIVKVEAGQVIAAIHHSVTFSSVKVRIWYIGAITGM